MVNESKAAPRSPSLHLTLALISLHKLFMCICDCVIDGGLKSTDIKQGRSPAQWTAAEMAEQMCVNWDTNLLVRRSRGLLTEDIL